MTIPPRAHQYAALICRIADELTAMGGEAELTHAGYIQGTAYVYLDVTPAGAAQRLAEQMRLTEQPGTDANVIVWKGQFEAFRVSLGTPVAVALSVATPVPVLHTGDATEDAA